MRPISDTLSASLTVPGGTVVHLAFSFRGPLRLPFDFFSEAQPRRLCVPRPRSRQIALARPLSKPSFRAHERIGCCPPQTLTSGNHAQQRTRSWTTWLTARLGPNLVSSQSFLPSSSNASTSPRVWLLPNAPCESLQSLSATPRRTQARPSSDKDSSGPTPISTASGLPGVPKR